MKYKLTKEDKYWIARCGSIKAATLFMQFLAQWCDDRVEAMNKRRKVLK